MSKIRFFKCQILQYLVNKIGLEIELVKNHIIYFLLTGTVKNSTKKKWTMYRLQDKKSGTFEVAYI